MISKHTIIVLTYHSHKLLDPKVPKFVLWILWQFFIKLQIWCSCYMNTLILMCVYLRSQILRDILYLNTPNVAVEWVELQLHIRETPGLNLGRRLSILTEVLLGFTQFLQENSVIVSKFSATTSVHILYNLLLSERPRVWRFDALWAELLTVSLNNR
jgi:hypothetical protein